MVPFVAGTWYHPGRDQSPIHPIEPIDVPRSDRAVWGRRHCHAGAVAGLFSG